MKIYKQTNTTEGAKHPTTLSYGDMAIANNGVPAIGNSQNKPIPVATTESTVAVAKKLDVARTIRTNLASTSTASFDGSANITPGVTGTLSIGNGGTGHTGTPSIITNLASTAGASPYAASPRPGVTGTLPIKNGGTGGTTAPAALAALGAEPAQTPVTQAEAEAGTSTEIRSWTPQMVAIAANAVKAAVPPPSPQLNTFSWTDIANISAAGNASAYWQIGDTKDLVLTTGEVLTMQIYGFGRDDITATEKKAGITFGSKNLMATTRRMNASNTNVNSFFGSEMYGWLSVDFYNLWPSDLKGLVRSVNKKTSAGDQSVAIRTDSMKVFLFSRVEVNGTTDAVYKDEGARYPIFTNDASRIKYLLNGSGSAAWWWLRSPSANSSSYFTNVSPAGGANNSYGNGARDEFGVAVGFCV